MGNEVRLKMLVILICRASLKTYHVNGRIYTLCITLYFLQASEMILKVWKSKYKTDYKTCE